MSAPTLGQRTIAHAVSARVEAGDSDPRIIADLLTVLAAVISDLPDMADRVVAMAEAARLPDVVNHLIRVRAAA